MEAGQAGMGQDGTDVLGRRIGAAFLDFLPLVVLFILLSLLIGDTEASGGSAQARLGTAGTLVLLAASLLYYFVLELLGGQTLGKRALGIRVVADGCGPASAGQIAARTLLRIVDGLPFLYLLGLVVAIVTKKRQRIGDLAGGTRVVRA